VNEPDKPWRVRADHGVTTEHQSMTTAFEQVKVVHGWGMTASVYRWGDVGWQLYRQLEPPGAVTTGDTWPF
jgi:hypothetical protein